MLKSIKRISKYWAIALLLGLFFGAPSPSSADTLSVFCDSPPVTAPFGGGTVTVNVDCAINAPNASSAYRITDSNDNFVTPGILLLNRGLSFLTATRQSSVTSPDGNVTSILGTSSGFTARLTSSASLQTVRFQYSVTTSRFTPAGRYQTNLGSASYRYRICTTPSCNQQVFSSLAPTSLTVDVPSSPISVSCASPTVNATPGGGPFSLAVVCTATGDSAGQFSPNAQNVFSPSSVTLSNGSHNLTATLQPVVTSPDSSVTGITGSAGGGFTGTIISLPAKLQVQYTGHTTVTTPAGTYTSTPVTFAWSTL